MAKLCTIYLPNTVMEGNAAEAIEFYQEALGATVEFRQTFGELPVDPDNPVPAGYADRISHATLKVGASNLMLRDASPGENRGAGGPVTIAVSLYDAREARRLFDALGREGRVTVPLQETFFSPAYGRVTDKFGVSFQIATQFDD